MIKRSIHQKNKKFLVDFLKQEYTIQLLHLLEYHGASAAVELCAKI